MRRCAEDRNRPQPTRPRHCDLPRAGHRDQLRRDQHRHRARPHVLSNTIASGMDKHSRFGGVVPEVAARAHLEALPPAIERAVAEAGVRLGDLDAVAVTSGPGLAGALPIIGVGAAKALAVSLGQTAVRREPPGRAHRRGHPDGGHRAARVPRRSRCSSPAGTRRCLHVREISRPMSRCSVQDDRRRRRGGVRQGRAHPRPAVSGGSADRPGGAGRRPRRDPVPPGAVAGE